MRSSQITGTCIKGLSDLFDTLLNGRSSSFFFGKSVVFQALPIVYSYVELEERTLWELWVKLAELEPKNPDALTGYSPFTAALFLAWEPQTQFFSSERRVYGSWDSL